MLFGKAMEQKMIKIYDGEKGWGEQSSIPKLNTEKRSSCLHSILWFLHFLEFARLQKFCSHFFKNEISLSLSQNPFLPVLSPTVRQQIVSSALHFFSTKGIERLFAIFVQFLAHSVKNTPRNQGAMGKNLSF